MDSGVGGLAVLNRIVTQLPKSPYVFLGDTAWMPYGERPLEIVRKRVLEIHAALHAHYSIAAFVLACNTATVAAYDDLESLNLPYPLLEPVKTTAMWVNEAIDPSLKIGILATPATVSTNRYLQFLSQDRPVKQVSCRGLASIVESGICTGPELDEILLPYLRPLMDWEADAIILGCTHYSLIRDRIQQVLGPHVRVIDSSEVLATVATPTIQTLDLGDGHQQMMVSGSPEAFEKAIAKLPLEAFLGHPVSQIELHSKAPTFSENVGAIER
jgi:glutamate racemase